ncbi:MAG: hypothetical protein ACYCXK_03775 [Candidatus Humimicrobiaceae bacterium]
MKKTLVIIIIVVISTTLVFFIGSCKKKDAEKVAEETEEAASKSEEIEVKMTDEEGNELIPGGTSVPEGWPETVPVNDKIKISFSGSSKIEGKTNWNISGTYSGTGQELYDWYKKNLSDWNTDSDSLLESDGEKIFSIQFSNNNSIVTVWITENDDEVVLIQNVSEK